MIKVYYRKKGIKIAQIWYPESEDLGKIKADIAFVHGVEKKEGSHSALVLYDTLFAAIKDKEGKEKKHV